MEPYYSDFGQASGLVSYRDVAGLIEVFEDPYRSIPIGAARCIGWDAAGSAVWRLIVQGEDLEDPCVIVDREFLATGPAWGDLYRSDFHADLDMRRSAPSPRKRPGARRSATGRRTSTGVQPSIP
jgi:hypothetical protein